MNTENNKIELLKKLSNTKGSPGPGSANNAGHDD